MHLFLIGNGNVGKNNTENELEIIDKIIVKSTNKENPNFLFVGLASSFADSYYDVMKKNYKSLGCETVYLKKSNLKNNPDIVKDKFDNADIIYFGGGDTVKLMDSIKEYNLEPLINDAVKRNTILVGISAGAIMFCKEGLSDYLITQEKSDKYAFTDGLSLVDISLCPHGEDLKRLVDLNEISHNKKVLIIESNACLEIDGYKCHSYSVDNLAEVILRTYEEEEYHDKIIKTIDLTELEN